MKILNRIFMCCNVAIRLLGINIQIIKGLWVIGRLPRPCITIFGGSRRFDNDDYYKKLASQAAHKLVHHDRSVVTGGGPGIMQAANCAAHATASGVERTLKVIITGLSFDEAPNDCAGESIYVSDFFARKWLLIDYSAAFIVFPGGLGTLDELSDLMNLIQTGKIKKRSIVLIGTEYWKPYKLFFDQARAQHFLHEPAPEFTITDDIDQAVSLVLAAQD